MSQRIDFAEIAAAALADGEGFLHRLIGGQRAGNEWQATRTRDGGMGDSLTCNLRSGAWMHGAADCSGGDLISLYAYVHGIGQFDAAKEVAGQYNIALPTDFAQSQGSRPAQAVASIKAPVPAEKSKSEPVATGNWLPIVPVPADAPPRPIAHVVRGRPAAVYEYLGLQGELLGYIWRFVKSDGVTKETLPLTFCVEVTTGATAWRGVGFAKPRPLYGLEQLAPLVDGQPSRPVLVVEGEKCVDFARQNEDIARTYDVISWVGGCKGVGSADFEPLRGRRIVLWPDCDAHTDKQTGVLLPRLLQPGEAAMRKLGGILLGMGCAVKLIDTPAPAFVKDGWDIADALEGGFNGDAALSGADVKKWIKDRVRDFEPTVVPALTKSAAHTLTLGTACAGAVTDPALREAAADKLRGLMQRNEKSRLIDCAHNVHYALRIHPDLAGLVAHNDFTRADVKTRTAPWGSPAGPWEASDDSRLNFWLLENLNLLVKAEGNINSGVASAADMSHFHPVRDYLNGLVWDGVTRSTLWLHKCLGAAATPYHALVGALMLRGAVSRVFEPGNKFDYCMVFEGSQGKGKSTALRILGGDWFSDTPIKIGDKDGAMALQGQWIIEIAELDSFNRAESTMVKAFITTQADQFRAPYDRRPQIRSRQCVFFGTTNAAQWLKDSTGSRRFWPVACGDVDLALLREWREQLLAEAVHEYKAKEPLYPSRQDEAELIVPEQELRTLDDAWESVIAAWLGNMDQKHGGGFGNKYTSAEILTGALEMPIDRVDGGKLSTGRVGQIMAKLKWDRRRESTGARLWYYHRPAASADDPHHKTNMDGTPF